MERDGRARAGPRWKRRVSGWPGRRTGGGGRRRARGGEHSAWLFSGALVGVAHVGFLVWGLARDKAGSGSQAPRGGTALHCDVGGSASAVRLHLRGLVTSSTGRWWARPWDRPACGRQGRRQAGPRRLLAAAGSAGAGPSVLVLRVQALLSAPQLITICKELRIKGKSEKSASSGSSRTVSSLTT